MGQAEQDDRQSNPNSSQADRDSPKPEKLSQSVSLSDADYEFLFNQLLEGIAYGWNNLRIAKFFERLGDRGKQSDWIAWLERLQAKIVTLPIQSRNQLGTMMIRFGELAQANSEISRIGIASRRIGRELLFSNTEDPIWEYVGPDLPSVSPKVEQELSGELSTNSAPLDSTIEPESASEQTIEEKAKQTPEITKPAVPDRTIDQRSEQAPSFHSGVISDSNNTEEIAAKKEAISEEDNTISKTPLKKITVSFLSDSSSTSLDEITTYSEEFEFELPDRTFNAEEKLTNSTDFYSSGTEEKTAREPLEENLTEPESDLSSSTTEELPNTEFTSANDSSPITQPSRQYPVAIDMQKVMNLIQEDEELAQQILQKLNVSSVQSNPSDKTDSPSPVVPPTQLEQSNLELIESWFNLGLKQVGAGKFAEAIASWEKALKINPNLSEAWHNRGSALGRLGKFEEAEISFQNALAIDPNNYQAWNDRAHALYQLQNWTEAVSSWDNAIAIVPGNHLFWYNRGCALEQLADWNGAIASYEKSLEIKPDFSPGRSRYINLVADNSRSN